VASAPVSPPDRAAPTGDSIGSLCRRLAFTLAVVLLTGCQTASRSPTVTESGAAADGFTADRETVERIDGLLAEMSRHLTISSPAGPANPTAVAFIQIGSFADHTEARPQDVQRFRRELLDLMDRLGRRHGLMFSDSRSPAGLPAYELQTAVFAVDDPADQWLLQLMLSGPRRDGERGVLWQDALLVDRP
jgi:hypothetical protein